MPAVQPEQLVLASLNKDRITAEDIRRTEDMCYASVMRNDLYSIRNDAKLRAVYSTSSYEEFKYTNINHVEGIFKIIVDAI